MPVAVHISPKHMTRDDCERVIRDLQASGAGAPEGRSFHAAYGDDDVRIFEVWDSREHFDAHRDLLYTSLLGVGLDAGAAEVHSLHSEHPD